MKEQKEQERISNKDNKRGKRMPDQERENKGSKKE